MPQGRLEAMHHVDEQRLAAPVAADVRGLGGLDGVVVDAGAGIVRLEGILVVGLLGLILPGCGPPS